MVGTVDIYCAVALNCVNYVVARVMCPTDYRFGLELSWTSILKPINSCLGDSSLCTGRRVDHPRIFDFPCSWSARLFFHIFFLHSDGILPDFLKGIFLGVAEMRLKYFLKFLSDSMMV